jgi:hypothetical protein
MSSRLLTILVGATFFLTGGATPAIVAIAVVTAIASCLRATERPQLSFEHALLEHAAGRPER